jgi:hypothetical protein
MNHLSVGSYDHKVYKVNYNKNYTMVENSYRADTKDLLKLVGDIRSIIYLKSNITYRRTKKSWAIEWLAHNRLFSLGLFPSHTKDVDFDEDESLLRRICYHIISIDYVIVLGFLKA